MLKTVTRVAAALAFAVAAGAAVAFGVAGTDGAGQIPPGVTADRLVVAKAARRLTLIRAGQPIALYRIALGFTPVGPKRREGDGKTPEGRYRISAKPSASRFHRSLRVSYPDAADRARAAAAGVAPGGDIMIHGLPNGLGWVGPLHRLVDWTAGCIAVTNAEIEEIRAAVRVGAPIEIRP